MLKGTIPFHTSTICDLSVFVSGFDLHCHVPYWARSAKSKCAWLSSAHTCNLSEWHFRTHLSSGLIWLDWVSKLPVSQLAANRVEPRKTSFLQNVLLLFQLEFQCVIIDIKSVFFSSGLNSIMCINNHIKLASFLITGIMNETFSFRQNLEGFWAHNSLSISMIYILSVTQLLPLVLGRSSDLCRSQLNHSRDLKAIPVSDEQAQDRPSQSPFVLAGCWDMVLVMLGHSSYGRWWSR